jgi:hypothetical protein
METVEKLTALDTKELMGRIQKSDDHELAYIRIALLTKHIQEKLTIKDLRFPDSYMAKFKYSHHTITFTPAFFGKKTSMVEIDIEPYGSDAHTLTFHMYPEKVLTLLEGLQ